LYYAGNSWDTKQHWEKVYRTKQPTEVSWFQPEATLSLDLITRAAPNCEASIVDVGGGASTLVDGLTRAGYHRLMVLDISVASLAHARQRLGRAGDEVDWRAADILHDELPRASFDLWHDRAVFHFLTTEPERARYLEQVRRAVKPNGFVLVATFAEDGPTRCSGLAVARYSADELHDEFGGEFRLVEKLREEHVTPTGAKQPFTYCLCQYQPQANARHAA
jgi:SAM-dependent methyltransferase